MKLKKNQLNTNKKINNSSQLRLTYQSRNPGQVTDITS
jgi:hypothetical protein